MNKHMDSSFQPVILKTRRLGVGNMVRVGKKSSLGLAYCETKKRYLKVPRQIPEKGNDQRNYKDSRNTTG